MKLKKLILNNKIIYTLKSEYNNHKTQDAHYKFIEKRFPIDKAKGSHGNTRAGGIDLKNNSSN